MTHFGSRGLDHKTATYFLNAGGTKDGIMVEPLVLGVSTALGYDYIQCMALAGEYAYAGRDWVTETVTGLLGAHILESEDRLPAVPDGRRHGRPRNQGPIQALTRLVPRHPLLQKGEG